MISIPLPFTPVPINLATLSVLMAGGLLGPRHGAISQAVYVLLGAVGFPVFSNFSGGLMKLAGPTGGYIVSYIPAALAVGLMAGAGRGGGRPGAARTARLAMAMACGMAVCYALGTAWFMISTNVGLAAALVQCVIPFIPGDMLKAAVGAYLCGALGRALRPDRR
jgi:biotin transport system substrate-specific component